jgi:hypothetical protein
MKLDLFRQILDIFSIIKFYENPPNGGDFFYMDRQKYRKTDTQRNVMKLIVAFRNFVKAFKSVHTNKTNEGQDASNGCVDSRWNMTTVHPVMM